MLCSIFRSFVFFALLTLLAPVGLLAETTGLQQEFDPPASGDSEAPSIELPRADFRLESSLSAMVFTSAEMNEIYNATPVFRLGLTTDIAPANQFLMSIGYGKQTAELDSGDPTFETDYELELEMVPLEIGLRNATARLSGFRINFVLAAGVVWLRERAPYYQSHPYFDAGTQTGTGWGHQLKFGIGPEWRLADDRWVVGFEAMGSAGGGSVGKIQRDVSLEGFSGRLYCSVKLGSVEDSHSGTEVSP